MRWPSKPNLVERLTYRIKVQLIIFLLFGVEPYILDMPWSWKNLAQVHVSYEQVSGTYARIKSLRDATKKMSKSDANHRSRIEISDPREMILEKCSKALSDFQSNITYDPEKRPAISNLVSGFLILRCKKRLFVSWMLTNVVALRNLICSSNLPICWHCFSRKRFWLHRLRFVYLA